MGHACIIRGAGRNSVPFHSLGGVDEISIDVTLYKHRANPAFITLFYSVIIGE